MERGDLLRNQNDGTIVEVWFDYAQPVGTKKRLEYWCCVVFPADRAGETLSVSPYDVGPSDEWRPLTELEAIAWAAK